MSEKLMPGQELLLSDELVSKEQRFRFRLQDDGNLVVLDEQGKALWASGTNNKKVEKCAMQKDGNLVRYRRDQTPASVSNTPGNSGSYLVVQDDGNVVVYIGEKPLWATGGDVPKSADLKR